MKNNSFGVFYGTLNESAVSSIEVDVYPEVIFLVNGLLGIQSFLTSANISDIIYNMKTYTIVGIKSIASWKLTSILGLPTTSFVISFNDRRPASLV